MLIQLCTGIPYGAPDDPGTLLAMRNQLPDGAIYGDTEIMPTPETLSPAPISPSGVAKLAIERFQPPPVPVIAHQVAQKTRGDPGAFGCAGASHSCRGRI